MSNSRFLKGDKAVLEDCPLFSLLSEEVKEYLHNDDRCGILDLKKGDDVTSHTSLVLITKGRIRVSKPENPSYTMRILKRGDIFGAATLFDVFGGESVSSLSAISDARAIVFPVGLVSDVAQKFPDIKDVYIRFLTSRIKLLNKKIDSLVCIDRERALAHYLAENHKFAMFDTVPLPSLVSLSEELNMGRASLYRAFESLENLGFIEKDGRSVKITDIDALRAYCYTEEKN